MTDTQGASTAELVARSDGGITDRQSLRRAGVTESGLRRAVADGDLRRIRRGFYATAEALPDAVAAVRIGGRLAGTSATRTFGLWGGWRDDLHVIVAGNASRLRSAPEMSLPPGRVLDLRWNDDRHDRRWPWRVSLDRCLRQVMARDDLETAIACVDTALTRKLIDDTYLERLRDSAPGTAAVLVGHAAKIGAGSGVESVVRQRLELRGLRLIAQYVVEGVGPVDFRVAGTPLLIEIDGFEFHSSRAKFADDRRRDAEARSRGYETMRFTAVQVRDQWLWVQSMVLSALAHRVE